VEEEAKRGKTLKEGEGWEGKGRRGRSGRRMRKGG